MRKQVISDHAVRRWFERVEGHKLAQPPDRPDADVLARLRKAGEDIELRRGFIARLTWEAVQVGACGMRWQGFRFPIENGTVRSVIAVKEKQREVA